MAENNTEGILKYPLKYNNLPNYGNYIFYYDITTGKLKYTFKYNRLANYGCYTFKYPTQDIIYVEKEILGNIYKDNKMINEKEYNLIYNNLNLNVNIENPSNDLGGIFLVRNAKILYSIDGFNLKNNKTRNKILIFEEDTEPKIINNNIGKIEDLELIDFTRFHYIDIQLPDYLFDRAMTFQSNIDKDVVLKRLIEQKIKLEDGYKDKEYISKHRNVISDNFAKLENPYDRNIIEEKEIREKVIHRNVIEEKEIREKVIHRNVIEGKTVIQKRKKHKSYLKKKEFNPVRENIYSDISYTENIKSNINNILDYYKDYSSYIDVCKEIDYQDVIQSIIKSEKSSKINKNESFTRNVSLNLDKKGTEQLINKTVKQTKIEDVKEEISKHYYDSNINDKEETLKSLHSNVEVEDIERNKIKEKSVYEHKKEDKLNKGITSVELDKKIEKRLSLHKRFWFLDNIGKMDIKILPNVDSQYPARIEIFDDTSDIHKYSYKYSDKFTSLDGDYEIKLYKSSITGLRKVKNHKIIGLHDYKLVYDEVLEVIMKTMQKENNGDYTVSFTINIDNIDFDYMVIEQPKGRFNNKFIFVSSEKFLAENHPIPMGEDMGIIEMPISIKLMVDFINILLLIWAKMYYTYSGCVGTRAIQSLSELVYEWLTLETSLNVSSIEAYNRCYRWLRWECEKTYNKAKFDPHLNGNLWVEEVIFEMIDYMEMHHFDNIPEWDDILRMDEQRNNLFNDINLDIPIVIEKFKGIRKRILKKNKRYRDY